MSPTSKRELLTALRQRYTLGNRTTKQRVLDEPVTARGYHRKYATQVLNHPPPRFPSPNSWPPTSWCTTGEAISTNCWTSAGSSSVCPIASIASLTQAERGDVMVQTALAPDHARALRRIERSVDRQMWAIVAAGLVIAGALLRSSPANTGLSTALFVGAGLAFLWGLTRR